jgi:hypothetical protein
MPPFLHCDRVSSRTQSVRDDAIDGWCGETEDPASMCLSAATTRPAPGAGTFQARCGSFRDLVSVIWGVAESASQRLVTGRNGQVQTDTLTDQVN